MTITKISDEIIEETQEIKRQYKKEILLVRKAQIEQQLIEINNLLNAFN